MPYPTLLVQEPLSPNVYVRVCKSSPGQISMASPFTALLGPELEGKSGKVNTAEALAGKVVGLYFSVSEPPSHPSSHTGCLRE
jgi:hypothetical protein